MSWYNTATGYRLPEKLFLYPQPAARSPLAASRFCDQHCRAGAAFQDFSQRRIAPLDPFAAHDRAEGFREMFAPPRLVDGRCDPCGGERLETRHVAHGGRGREK